MPEHHNKLSPKIGVVILNYRTYKDTIECVYSILRQTYVNFHIAIVENGSDNQSLKILTKEFVKNPLVTIIKSTENLGFARGNNLGINYLSDVKQCEYVFVLNSDTIVHEKVLEEVLAIKTTDSIGVISPTVKYVNGAFQRPGINFKNIKRHTFISCTFVSIGFILHFFLRRTLGFLKDNRKEVNGEDVYVLPSIFNPFVMHGSSYFLTPSFFKYYNQLYPRTFLYWEEINLMWYLYKVGLTCVMVNTNPVVHKKSQSVSEFFSNRKFMMQKYKMSFKSMMRSLPMFFMRYEKIKKRYSTKELESGQGIGVVLE